MYTYVFTYIRTCAEPVWDRCKLTCFDFCGLTKVQWHTNSDASQEL